MAEILAIGTGAASSTDVVVADGSTTGVHITTTSGVSNSDAQLLVEIKNTNGTYTPLAILGRGTIYMVLNPGTWRVRREATSAACGADQN